jgi:hypothetical protein
LIKGSFVSDYVGRSIVKHVFKMPKKDLTREVLYDYARAHLGLPKEHVFKLTYMLNMRYALHPEREFTAIDILFDGCFKFFMGVVDELLKPVELYYSVNL